MNKYCDEPIKAKDIRDVHIDNLANLPDYFLAERETVDETRGITKHEVTRVPAARLFPNANFDNIFPLEANNPAIEVPENQVRACYVFSAVSTVMMQYADVTHPAQFLAVGGTADFILCQNCGVVNLPKGHDYIIGMQYYTGENGEPVTDATSNNKLFIPISNTKLLINIL